MRTITCCALALASLCAFSPLCGQQPYIPCPPDPLTGNTVSLFDWRTEFYELHLQSEAQPLLVSSPFHSIGASPFQLNTVGLAVFPQDFEPEAGWEVLLVNFGTPAQKVSTPTLVLYNRLNGIMRILQYAREDINTYESATLEVAQILSQDVFTKNSAVFEHMNTPMNALDNFAKRIVVESPNHYRIFPPSTSDRTWLLGEILTAYDPCTCSHPTRFVIQSRFRDITRVNLNITGQGNTVPVYEQQSGHAGGMISALAGAANVANNLAKGGKTYKDLQSFEDFIRGVFGSIVDSTSNLPAFISNVTGQVPTIGAAISLLDLFVNSNSSPRIASYDSRYTFEAEGTLEKDDLGVVTSFRTPGAIEILSVPTNVETVQVLYDNPLGIMNLMHTPEIYIADKSLSGGTNLGSYKISDEYDFKYVVNHAASLNVDPKSIRFQLVFKDCTFMTNGYAENNGLLPTGVDGQFATPLMPAECLKDFTLNFVWSTLGAKNWCGDPWERPVLKIVASLNDDVSGGNVLYVASYQTTLKEAPYAYDDTPPNPYLNIKEDAVVNYEDFDPRQDLEAWNTVKVTAVPGNILIDPLNPNIQTLLPTEFLIPVYGEEPEDARDWLVSIDEGVSSGTYDVTFEGIPPCSFTHPASAAEIAAFCANTYDPSVNLVEDDELWLLQSPPAGAPPAAEVPRLKLYPQPASDWAQLELPAGQGRGRLMMMNAYGQVVLVQDIRSFQVELDVAGLPAGLYLLSIDLFDGQPPYTERLAKQ
jgi:hypothetical protein